MSHKQAKQSRAAQAEFTFEELQTLRQWANIVGYQIPPGTAEQTRAHLAHVQSALALHDALVSKLDAAIQRASPSSSSGSADANTQTT